VAVHDNNTVVIGTEAGVYACSNAFTSGPYNWYPAYGLPKIPVYAMAQQTKRYIYDENHPPLIENAHYRAIYIGTHGRGIWKTTSLTGLEDKNKPAKPIAKREATLQFKVYPNPMNSVGSMEINMPKEDRAVVEIYDLNGRLVSTVSNRILQKGNNKLDINISNFRNGTYLATVKVGDEMKVSKFLVIK
jgi:hypothetical protein